MSLKEFKLLEKIHQDSFSTIHKASKGGKDFAIEIFKNPSAWKIKDYLQFSFSSPFLQKYQSYFEESGSLCLVSDLFDTSLATIIDDSPQDLTDDFRLKVIIQLLLAVRELHSKRIIHRNIKAESVFLIRKTVKLGGGATCYVSKEGGDESDNKIVSADIYRAPEVWKGERYSYPIDIWSLGVLFYYMCACEPPFRKYSDKPPFGDVLQKNVLAGEYKPLPQIIPAGLTALIKSMLVLNPSERPSVVQLLATPFIRDYASKLELVI